MNELWHQIRATDPASLWLVIGILFVGVIVPMASAGYLIWFFWSVRKRKT